jgi:GGDEF-like domain/PucR C-terminal helix-turn-helix domain
VRQRQREAASEAAQARLLLAERLREQMPEIERSTLTRLQGISEAPERPDPDYAEGLRSATSAALEYLLAGVERCETDSLHPPPAVLVQARLAARSRVPLDTVLRRCFAGHALFSDFLMGELEHLKQADPELPKRLLREQAVLFDRMLAAVSEEHLRETTSRAGATRRRARLIERLLAGEPLSAAELGYEMQAHHLAVVAKGPRAAEAVRELAAAFDRRLLVLLRNGEVLWAWLAGRKPLDSADVLRRASVARPPELHLAVGEPGEGPEGWRLSHRQARAAFPVALRGEKQVVRYADVAILATAIHDELLAISLPKLYLEPLAQGHDGGALLRKTLRAYFLAECNAASAAATCGVSRQAVNGRLRTIEARLGRSLASCRPELEAALQMDALS